MLLLADLVGVLYHLSNELRAQGRQRSDYVGAVLHLLLPELRYVGHHLGVGRHLLHDPVDAELLVVGHRVRDQLGGLQSLLLSLHDGKDVAQRAVLKGR